MKLREIKLFALEPSGEAGEQGLEPKPTLSPLIVS